jgi:hypothetical protein
LLGLRLLRNAGHNGASRLIRLELLALLIAGLDPGLPRAERLTGGRTRARRGLTTLSEHAAVAEE